MFNKYLKRHFKTYLKVSILVLICFFVFAKTSNHSNIIPSNKGEEAIYSEILDSYYYNIQNEWKDYSFEGYTDRKSNDYKCYLFPSYMSGSEYGELIGYSFIDLNDDGVSELLIGLKKFPNEPQEYYTPIIYDMYTYCAGSVYHIASSGERYRYELCEDYSIYYSGSGGAGIWSNTRCIYREGKELSIIEDIYSDRINDDLSTQLYYYHEDNPEVFHLIGEDRHNINYEFIDYEQAEIIRKTWPKTVNFKLNLFSNYSPQNPKPKSYRYNEYKRVISEINAENPAQDTAQYTLFDISKDGIPELLVRKGDSDDMYQIYIYYVYDEEIMLLGVVDGWKSSLGYAKDGSFLIYQGEHDLHKAGIITQVTFYDVDYQARIDSPCIEVQQIHNLSSEHKKYNSWDEWADKIGYNEIEWLEMQDCTDFSLLDKFFS